MWNRFLIAYVPRLCAVSSDLALLLESVHIRIIIVFYVQNLDAFILAVLLGYGI